MSIWIPPTIAEQPGLVLSGWSAFKVLLPEIGSPTAHLAGYNERAGEGRVSSPLESFDATSRCGITSSGRVYRLSNHSGLGGEASYVWGRWLGIWSATVLQELSLEELAEFLGASHEI